MGTDTVERAHGMDNAFAGDIEMIAATVETTLQVFTLQFIGSKTMIAAGGGAMHYDKVDRTDAIQAQPGHTVGWHCGQAGGYGLANDDRFLHGGLMGAG